MLPSIRALRQVISPSPKSIGNFPKRSLSASILAEISKTHCNGEADGEMEEHARCFLLKSLQEDMEASGSMVYSLSQASSPEQRKELPLTDMMRSQIAHAATTGKYLQIQSRSIHIDKANSVLENTKEEKDALREAALAASLEQARMGTLRIPHVVRNRVWGQEQVNEMFLYKTKGCDESSSSSSSSIVLGEGK
uniref:Uncharacterized protein n=1 Tax=Leptocylindrus danicus TaxID=163516 RepID=A0A7S2KQ48_9STRA|mmetsp:Transcript_24684/g.37005  ORF Transcript_24684/g.37005 Transcript_24684/m.37005 type:complete len:194 (+) Transcript_24684:437-1018(+)|eukprot:CAMPEP_0116024214 /NCGR_PEP_ID=MMETSP0321-20121206/12167_1 /TAXON_ID=163516 /ORGANISM="Leptocylindrus danicus var. danicus, Strain B650" /LENGTH=193 /DNA_ID=CAMNT_0003495869 /DNA_START=254 /DNA_END=835 /DNA_ORIENTATION=+